MPPSGTEVSVQFRMSVLNNVRTKQGRKQTPNRITTQLVVASTFFLFAHITFASVQDHIWCSYDSGSFQIISDLKPERAVQLHSFLERFKLAAQLALGLQDIKLPEQVKIIAFRSQRDFQTLTQTRKYVGFMQPSLGQSTLVLGASKPSTLRNQVAAHEYVHYLMRKTSKAFRPMWYEEGMAGYLSTLRVSRRGMILGEVPNNLFKKVLPRKIDIKQLLSENSQAGWGQKKTGRFYREAWLLVHYLKHGPHSPEQLSNFIQQLSDGVESQIAFLNAFNTSFKSMQKSLQVYAQRPRPAYTTLAFTPPSAISTSAPHCLSPYEVRHTLGSALQSHNPNWATEMFLLQLAQHPEDLPALTHLSEIYASQGNTVKATLIAEDALAKYPDQASSQIQSANMLVSSCLSNRSVECFEKLKRAQTLYRKALRANSDRIDGVFGMGMTQLFLGRPGEALKYFQVAYLKAPWAPILNFYLGETYREVGDQRNARLYLSRANYWAVQPGIQRLSIQAYSLLEK